MKYIKYFEDFNSDFIPDGNMFTLKATEFLYKDMIEGMDNHEMIENYSPEYILPLIEGKYIKVFNSFVELNTYEEHVKYLMGMMDGSLDDEDEGYWQFTELGINSFPNYKILYDYLISYEDKRNKAHLN